MTVPMVPMVPSVAASAPSPGRRCLLLAAAAIAVAAGRPAGVAAADTPAPIDIDARLAAAIAAGGFLLMIRHASTVPGVGDPPDFDLARCETQRNLSDAGRAEARRLGAAIRQAGLKVDAVRSSAWCRCRDTATLAFGGAEVWAPINSFFGERDSAAAQTAAVVRLAAEAVSAGRNIVLVTHQVNISAATGVYPRQGELIVARHQDGRLVPRYRAFAG